MLEKGRLYFRENNKFPEMSTESGWLWWRDQCRRNIYFLCRRVLGYTDVNEKVHRKLIDKLQKFQGGLDDFEFKATARGLAFKKTEEHQGYDPAISLWELKGS